MLDNQRTTADLANRFTYHPPAPGDPELYQLLRDQAHQLALLATFVAAPSRELSLAITHLEDTVMWANAALARHGRALPARSATPSELLLLATDQLRRDKPDSLVAAHCAAGWDHRSEA